MTAYVLVVCLGFSEFWGACGRTINEEFSSKAECHEVLASFKPQPKFSYGYCKPKKP